MENFGDDSDNDMDRIMGNDNEFGDVSAEEDEAIEDNTHNNGENKHAYLQQNTTYIRVLSCRGRYLPACSNTRT